jgi:hypothetical protein
MSRFLAILLLLSSCTFTKKASLKINADKQSVKTETATQQAELNSMEKYVDTLVWTSADTTSYITTDKQVGDSKGVILDNSKVTIIQTDLGNGHYRNTVITKPQQVKVNERISESSAESLAQSASTSQNSVSLRLEDKKSTKIGTGEIFGWIGAIAVILIILIVSIIFKEDKHERA